MILKSDAKFEEKPICCFKNNKNLVNFDLSIQVSKICTVTCPFYEKYITFDQKKYKELPLITLKSHAKFEEKLACGLENDMRNLANFHQNIWKCQNWYFHGIILSKVENSWATNYRELYVMTLENDISN